MTKTEAKHTRGPWSMSKTYDKGEPSGIVIHPPHFYFEGEISQVNICNARLIAAAPELLEAAKGALEVLANFDENEISDWHRIDGIIAELKAAIVKAEGGK